MELTRNAKGRFLMGVRRLLSVMLYHLVPRRLVGSRLLPLGRLRDLHPELYVEYVRKYEGREYLLERRVPGLGCLWSDVLFFTAVPPSLIRTLHEEAGFTPPPLRWFEVDMATLEESSLYVYWYLHHERERVFEPDNWEPFKASLLPRIRDVPQATRDHYLEAASSGRAPFAFFRIPHVLYRGDIDVRALHVVEA